MATPVIVETSLDRVIPLRIAFLFSGDRLPHEVVDQYDDDQARHWVITRNGVDIACATLALCPREVAGIHVPHRLRWLGVHPDHQRQGHGTALIAQRLSAVQDAGGEYAWTSARLTAANTYLNLGAVPGKETYLDDGTITHIDMRYGPLPEAVRIIEERLNPR